MESNQKSVNEDTIKTKQMKLEVEKTAILFIEYQNEFLSDGGKLSKDIIEKSSLVANSADLANKAREMGVKIIHVAFFSTADSEDCKSTCKEIDTTQGPLGGIKAAGYFKEDWNIKFIDAMKPKAGDIVMHKHRLDTFQNTNLKELLDKHGIQTLAVAGLLTHACVESTIRSAYDKDYQVVGLVDCTATNIKGYKDFVMKNTWPLFCEPMTKDQFLTSMERQDSEKIEGVNKDVKAKESKSLTLNVGLSDANEVVENTKVTVQEHTIVVDGSELSERKELEFVVDGNSEGQRSSIFRDLQILSNSNEKRSGVCWRKTMIPTKPSDVLSVWSTLSARGIVQEEPKDDQTREKVCHCIVVSDVAPTMSSKRIIVKFSR